MAEVRLITGQLADALARAERAEAAIERVRAELDHWEWDALGNTPVVLVDAILAALDSTDPVEAAPEECRCKRCEVGLPGRGEYILGDWTGCPIHDPALGTHPDVPAPGRSGEEKPHCPTCGPTSLELHPRLPVLRCANCKEHIGPVDGEEQK